MNKLDKVISIIRTLKEEGAPTMNLGAGQIAGTIEASKYDPNFTPPVNKKKEKEPTIIGRGKFPGARKRWMS